MSPEERVAQLYAVDCPGGGDHLLARVPDADREGINCEICVADAIRAAVEEEREAAADVASRNGAPMIAALIRARGNGA